MDFQDYKVFLEDSKFKDPHVIEKISMLVHQINLHTILALLNNINGKKTGVDLEQALKENLSMGLVETANKDTEQILGQEMENGDNTLNKK